MKKTVSLFLALCMMCVCFVQVSFAEETAVSLPAVSIIAGQSYALPETVGDYANINWTTTLDTNNVGIQTMEGSSGETPVTMVVNVGEEAAPVHSENFETGYESLPKWGGNGQNTFRKAGGGANLVFNSHAGVEQLDGNYVFKVYPDSNTYETRIQEIPKTTVGKPYRFNFKARFDLDKDKIADSKTASIVRVSDYSSTSWVYAHIYVYPKGNKIYAKPDKGVETEVCSLDANYSTGWMDFDVTTYPDCTYALTVNGKDAGKANKFYNVTANDWTTYRPASVSVCVFDKRATVYLDDINVYGERYVKTDIDNMEVNTSVMTGKPSDQQIKINLEMTDGTTREFGVKYTADTTTQGTKTAVGTIDGFSKKITVKYNVVGIVKKTVNTYIGATLQFEDGSVMQPTKMGRTKRTVSTDSAVYEYTINVGFYGQKLYDSMESHQNTTYTNGNKTIDTILPGNGDGLKLVVKNYADENEYSAVIDKDENNNNRVKFDKFTSSDNVQWQITDRFNGDFRVTVKAAAKSVKDKQYTGTYIRIYDTENRQITQAFAPRFYGNELRLDTQNDGGTDNSFDKTGWHAVNWNVRSTITGDVITTEEYEITFDIHSDTKTYDVMINNTPVKMYTGIPFAKNAAEGNIGSVRLARRIKENFTDYYDDLRIYQYNCFAGDLPETVYGEIGVGQDKPQTIKVPLTLTNGAVMDFDASVNADTTKIAKNVNAAASIEGFDEPVSAVLNIVNYSVGNVVYKNGDEFTPCAMPNGQLAAVNLVNLSGRSGADVLAAAWFNRQGKLEKVKLTDIPKANINENVDVNVNMQLPSTVEGGFLKLFITDGIKTFSPIDFMTQIDYQSALPTVYMAGDSTMCSYTSESDFQWPKAGVGQVIDKYLDNITVNNHAVSGSWVKSFVDNKYWSSITRNLKTGDYVIISFGHNDEGNCSGETCVYGNYLKKFIDETREKGANPIMYTPVVRLHEYNKENAFNYTNSTLHRHLETMERVCKENNVPFVDMTSISKKYISDLVSNGDNGRKLYMVDLLDNPSAYTPRPEWQKSCWKTSDGYKNDTSHYSMYGAKIWAYLLTSELKNKNLSLSQYIKNSAAPVYPALD